MKNIVAKISIALIIIPFISFGAMMPPASHGQAAGVSDINYFSSIPRELKTIIVDLAVNGKSEDEAIQAIKNMRLTSKDFNKTIDSLIANGNLIEYITMTFESEKKQLVHHHFYRNHLYSVAKKLGGIPAAQQWLKRKQENVQREDQFHNAIFMEHNLTRAKELIGNGISVNTLDQYGFTPLTRAMQFINDPTYGEQYKQFIDFLLEQGADVNLAANGNNVTPLAIASSNLAPNMIEKLLARKANSNVYDGEGKTPLMNLIGRINRPDADIQRIAVTIKALLAGGAQPNLKSKNGRTALDLAYILKAPQEIMSLLRQYGAKTSNQLP